MTLRISLFCLDHNTMILFNRFTPVAATALAIMFAAQTLWGQNTKTSSQTDDSEVLELEDFVVKSYLYSDQVNALKTPTPIIDVPQSLSIVSSDDIALRGFDSISDIVDYTPGVNTSQGEGHRDAVVFRGVRSTADFFVDGIRDDVQYYRPLYNVEQLEILRGPNALFFGRGGTGGILNRVTKKGIIGEDFHAYIISSNTFGATEAQLDSNVAINENTAFRLNLFYEGLENHRDYFDGDRYGVNPTIRFQPDENTIIDLSYEYIDHERFIDRGIPTGTDGKPVKGFEDIVFGDPELNESTLEAHVVRALLQHNFSDNLKANFSASYGDYDKFYQNLYTDKYVESTNLVTLDGYADATERQNTVLSGNLIGKFFTADIEHTVIFGAEYINTDSDQDRLNANWTTTTPANPNSDKEDFTAPGPFTINGTGVNSEGFLTTVAYTDPNDDTRADINVYSFYVQDEIQLLKQLQLVLGARFDSFDISVKDVVDNGTRGSQKDEEVTPRLGIVYKAKENVSVYASYSETFLPQSGEQFANLGDEGLDPDEFINLEAGVKWDFSQSLSFAASIFKIEQDVFEIKDNGFNRVKVESEITGFETQLQGRLTENWFITAGYSYLDGEVGDQDPKVDGNRPRELPEHMFSCWNRYQVTEKLGLGLGLIYQDESYITEDNDTKLPSYARLDAAAYYTVSENLRLQLNIENLTDTLYFPNSHADHQVTVGPPIHARFSINGRF